MAATRTPNKKEADRAEVARLYLERRPIDEIARTLGLNRKTVMADLRVIRERWQKEATEALSARLAEELARIDRIECAAWEGYYRSVERAERRKGQRSVGDPRWLDRVCWCVAERAKLLGLYAPARTEGRFEFEHHHTVETEFDREFARLLERLEARGEGLEPQPDEILPRDFSRTG